jgi:hypothetical protein
VRYALTGLAFAAAAAALAACNNGGGTTLPRPGPTCTPPPGTQSALVYPAPGSTAIPDRFGQVVIGSAPALPPSWDVVLVTPLSPFGLAGGTFTTATPPFPSPNATPAFANPVYQSSSFAGASFPGEVVRVFLNNTAAGCTPAGPIGSFTTQ